MLGEIAEERALVHFETDRPISSPKKTSALAETLARMKKVKRDHTAHLRRSPLQMGVPQNLTSSYTFGTLQPVQKANDPKWSTELRLLDKRMGAKNLYDARLTASITGAMLPEPMFFPKTHLPSEM